MDFSHYPRHRVWSLCFCEWEFVLLPLGLHHTVSRCFWKWSSPIFVTPLTSVSVGFCLVWAGLGQFAFVLSCRLSGVRLQGQRKFTDAFVFKSRVSFAQKVVNIWFGEDTIFSKVTVYSLTCWCPLRKSRREKFIKDGVWRSKKNTILRFSFEWL